MARGRAIAKGLVWSIVLIIGEEGQEDSDAKATTIGMSACAGGQKLQSCNFVLKGEAEAAIFTAACLTMQVSRATEMLKPSEVSGKQGS